MSITAEQAMGMTLTEIVCCHYLPEKERRRQRSTLYGYKSSMRLHVIPKWGEYTLGEITHDLVQAWVDELVPTDAGPGGAEKACNCLRQIFNWSLDKWGLFLAVPTRRIEYDRKPAYRPETLTERRIKKLIRGMVGCVFEPTIIIQAALGLRPSENYYLRWEQINWRNGSVPIKGSLHEIPRLIYESLTKTAKGDRMGFLPPWALDRLHAIWVERGRPKGRIIGDAKPSKVYRTLKRWAKRNRLPWVGMRNLRHSWGTIAAKNNPIEAVAAMMGHSNIQITFRYYYQLTLATIRRVQRKVARSILGKTSDDMYKGINIVVHRGDELPMAA